MERPEEQRAGQVNCNGGLRSCRLKWDLLHAVPALSPGVTLSPVAGGQNVGLGVSPGVCSGSSV